MERRAFFRRFTEGAAATAAIATLSPEIVFEQAAAGNIRPETIAERDARQLKQIAADPELSRICLEGHERFIRDNVAELQAFGRLLPIDISPEPADNVPLAGSPKRVFYFKDERFPLIDLDWAIDDLKGQRYDDIQAVLTQLFDQDLKRLPVERRPHLRDQPTKNVGRIVSQCFMGDLEFVTGPILAFQLLSASHSLVSCYQQMIDNALSISTGKKIEYCYATPLKFHFAKSGPHYEFYSYTETAGQCR